MNEQSPNELNLPDVPGIPEYYIDSFGMQASSYTVRFLFSLQTPNTRVPMVSLLMSPEHAKMMALVLTKSLHEYEEQVGYTIPVADKLLADKGIDIESAW